MRRLLQVAMVLALIAGPAIIVAGLIHWQKVTSLKSTGKQVNGELLDRTTLRSWPRPRYVLTVVYTTENGEYRKDFEVNEKAFNDAQATGTVEVTYLGTNSTVVGHQQATWERAAFGLGVTVFGLLLLGVRSLWKGRRETNATVA